MTEAQIHIGTKARHRRSIDRRLLEVGEALNVLVNIDEHWLWEMQRRREQLAMPDGMGSSGGADGGSRSTDETSTTERAALQASAFSGCRRPLYMKPMGAKQRFCVNCTRAESDHVTDPIGAAVEEVMDLLDRATQSLRQLGRTAVVVLHAADGHRERQSSLDACSACTKEVTGIGEDRIKASFGPCCYTAWKRWVRRRDSEGLDQSPVIFRWERRNELQAAETVIEEAC